MSESDSINEVRISINQKPYLVEYPKNISYDDVLKVTKFPQGSSVFYVDTKVKPSEFKAGFLVKGESIPIREGLNISCMRKADSIFEEGESI